MKDPVEFVQQLLTQKDKFDAIVLRSFQNDKAFQNALNQAFEHFINLNQRSPEYISLFMDDKLRKGLKVGVRPGADTGSFGGPLSQLGSTEPTWQLLKMLGWTTTTPSSG